MEQIRILLAEDNASHRLLLSRVLTSEHSDVVVFLASGRQSIESGLTQSTPVDCVVLDYNLPPHSAASIIDEFRDALAEIPVIVISASQEQSVVIESLRSGVDDFLPKDEALKPGVLWSRVRQVVQRQREAREDRRREDRRLRAMERMVDTDPLTKLYNRRYVDRVLESGRLEGDRRGPHSCVMVDVDHFKRVNDEFGHFAGDRVLQGVASTLREEAGSGVVARWGGEEFLVLLPSTESGDAWAWADEVREKLAAEDYGMEGVSVRVTASFGVSTVARDGGLSGAIREADNALYLAKDHGRNRVCSWSMVRAMEAADQVTMGEARSLEERFIAWMALVGPWLGLVQHEHVMPHGEAVRDLAVRIAGGLGLEGQALSELALAARLHDIGKVCVPETLLAKPESLTCAEKRCVDAHSRFGADLVRTLGASEYVQGVVAHHHVRFDSRPGAIEAKTEGGIARGAAIVTAADAVVAMMSDRPYAKARSETEAREVVQAQRGHQFEPEVVDAFSGVSVRAAA